MTGHPTRHAGPHATATVLAAIALALGWAPPARALDEAGAKAVIDRFLAAQKPDGAEPSAAHHAIGDLDGDGRADLVLQWDELGPTWWRSRLTVLIDQGRTYRALTTDLTGKVERLRVQGSTITVDTLTLGPKDPRCCPSVQRQVVYRWAGGKLVGAAAGR